MRTIRLSIPRLYPLPITLFRVFHRPLSLAYASFPISPVSTIILLIYSLSLSFSHIPFQSRSLTLAHTLASDQVLAFLTNIRRTTSARKHEPRSSKSRLARVHSGRASQNQNPTRPGWTTRGATPSARGSRTRKRRSAADRDANARRIRIGDFGRYSRRIGAGNRARGVCYARVVAAATAAAAPPTLARSSRLAVTNSTRSFGQNRCILQRRQIGLYVYE